METEITAKIEGYINTFNAINEKVKDKNVAIAIMQEMGKDRRGREMAELQQMPRRSMKASYKQIAFLKGLGISFDEATLTKGEASALIEQAKAQQVAAQ